MKLILTYICCGIGLLSTCFGEEAYSGALPIVNNTAFTLVFPSKINVYANQAHSYSPCHMSVRANPIEPYSSSMIEYTKKGPAFYYCDFTRRREVNYSFYVQFQGDDGASSDSRLVEVNYPQGEENQWVDPFEDEDEDKNYRETLSIVWEDAKIDGKPGVIFYQRARRIRGGTVPNPFIEDLRAANKLDIE